MLMVSELKKYYKIESNIIKAVDGITYRFENGKFYAITGRSGSGKSTFLSLLGGLINADSGKIEFNGKEITGLNDNKLSEYRNKSIGIVFQNYCLEPTYTCIENVLLPTYPAGTGKAKRNEAAGKILEYVGMSERNNQQVKSLSGGEKQRIALARALINNPDIILADEPTGNLDSENGKIVMSLLRKIADDGKTVIMVTHNQEDALKADAVLRFVDGRIDGDYPND